MCEGARVEELSFQVDTAPEHCVCPLLTWQCREATKLCVDDYGAGSHMCTVYELYYSATQLKNLDPQVDIAPGGWVYMQSWRRAPTNPVEATAGLADNCGGYTYTFNGTDTNQWDGTTFAWTVDASGVRVPKFYANTLCNVSQPIACCR